MIRATLKRPALYQAIRGRLPAIRGSIRLNDTLAPDPGGSAYQAKGREGDMRDHVQHHGHNLSRHRQSLQSGNFRHVTPRDIDCCKFRTTKIYLNFIASYELAEFPSLQFNWNI